MKKKGRMVIISGPSGSGKTTLYQKLLVDKKLKGRLVRSVSATTRPKRLGEKQGRDYFFVSRKSFLYKIKAGHFLEWQKFFSRYYGTPLANVRQQLARGRHVLLCIDVKGARVVWRRHPDALKIFIKPPSLCILRDRLENRGTESPKTLAIRLRRAKEELKEAKYYDYVVINDRLDKSYRILKRFLSRELSLS